MKTKSFLITLLSHAYDIPLLRTPLHPHTSLQEDPAAREERESRAKSILPLNFKTLNLVSELLMILVNNLLFSFIFKLNCIFFVKTLKYFLLCQCRMSV